MDQHKTTTGAAAISWDFDPEQNCYVQEIRLHLTAAGAAGDLVISHDSAKGTNFDVVHRTVDMTLVESLVWRPEGKGIYVAMGDKVNFAWANASTRTYGLEVLYK